MTCIDRSRPVCATDDALFSGRFVPAGCVIHFSTDSTPPATASVDAEDDDTDAEGDEGAATPDIGSPYQQEVSPRHLLVRLLLCAHPDLRCILSKTAAKRLALCVQLTATRNKAAGFFKRVGVSASHRFLRDGIPPGLTVIRHV